MTHPSRPDDDFPDVEVTQVVRTRLLPRDFDAVHEGHKAKTQIQIDDWKTTFDLKALGKDGCLISGRIARRLRPFPLLNQCQLTISIPNEPPVVINAHIDHLDIRKKGYTALQISFRDLSEEDQAKLSTYQDFLRNPPHIADEITHITHRSGRLMPAIRRRFPLSLGLALAAFSFDTPPNVPRTSTSTTGIQEIQTTCRIRFADGVYFPKCGDTVEERRSTKLEFLPKDEQPAQGKSLTLKADLQFERGGRSCGTVTPLELVKGETIEGSVHFACDESPR